MAEVKNVEKFHPIDIMVDLIYIVLSDNTKCQIQANKRDHACKNSFAIDFVPVFNFALFIDNFNFEIQCSDHA
jgi:hypothetical protein